MIGHSYGGIIAAKASLERSQISYVVLLGSPGVKNGEILFQQIGDISRSFGINDTTIEKFQNIIKNTSEILNSNKSPADKRLHVELMYICQIHGISESEKSSLKKIGYDYFPDAPTYSKLVFLPYFYEFYTFNPQLVLKKVQCPILSLIGEKDLQVDPIVNQPVIERALREGGNKTYTIHTPAGYNHLFQKSIPGNPMDYESQTTTITPEILKYINTWIKSQHRF